LTKTENDFVTNKEDVTTSSDWCRKMNSPSVSYSTKKPLQKLFGTANIILTEVFFF